MPDSLSSSNPNLDRTLDDFHQLDFEEGVIKNRRTGTRMVMLTSGAWVSLNSTLRQAFGAGASTYMHQIGYAIGTSFGQELKAGGAKPEAIMDVLPSVGKTIGWGHWSYSGDTKNWKVFNARVEDCPSCVYEQSGTPPLCDLLVGVINGLQDEIFASPHVVTETRCGYKGDGVCEFSVEQTREKSEEQRHWASFVMFPWLRRGR